MLPRPLRPALMVGLAVLLVTATPVPLGAAAAERTFSFGSDQPTEVQVGSRVTVSATADPPLAKVNTETQVSVDARSALVAVTGGVQPTGTVTVRVGDRSWSASLGGDGAARVPAVAARDQTRTFTASYSGDTHHTASRGDYTRTPPDLRLRLNQAPPRQGWYRGPVRVHWVCTPGSSEVTQPRRYTLFEDGQDWRVSATCRATDGGETSRGRGGIDVDGTAPRLSPRRTGRAPYPVSARPIRCRATDATSGLRRCRVTYGAPRRQGGERVRPWTATATDVAGNRVQRRGSFPVRG